MKTLALQNKRRNQRLSCTCNAGDPGSIPALGRSVGEGTGYPLQYSWGSLVAQLERIYLQCRRSGFDSWVGRILWRRDRLPTPVFLGFPCALAGKESTCNVGIWVRSLGWKSPWRREQLPSPEFWPGEFHRLYSPWGLKESDTAERLPLTHSLTHSWEEHI